MKKLFSLALVLAMLLSLSVTAFAAEITGDSGSVIVTYGVDDAYIVTIPASIALSADEDSTIGISAADVVIGYGELLTVSVGSSNYDAESSKWYLVDAENADNKLEYSVKNGENAVASGDAVLTVAAGNTGGGEVTLTTRLVDTAAFSGTYKDTITFTVSVAACTHNWANGTCTICGVKAYIYDELTNTYTVYTADALNTAISNAGTSGTTDNPAIIKLAADVEVAGTPNEYGDVFQALLVDKGVITLDLNGYTITTTGEASYTIMVDNGATLTINDSSEGKQGKIANDNTVLRSYNGKLVINGGTFEGNYAVEGWDENSVIEINGGTFNATLDAIRAQTSTLTITGGTFTGGRYALNFNAYGTYSVTGGSFYGEQLDISTAGQVGFLSYNQETGTGPSFPGGLSIYTTEYLGFNLNALLAEGAAYYDADGEKIVLDSSAASCEGDVTVKKVN